MTALTTLCVQTGFFNSKRRWFWPVALAALIFAASSRSQLAAPEVSGGDKVVHFAVYGLLATLVVRLRRSGWAALVTVLVVSAYGISDEWHQSFTPGRSVELADWLADTCGAGLAVALYRWWPGYQAWLEKPVVSQRRIENPAVLPTDSTA